jgi:tetratricopeptide (TPR) repeat protein
MNSPSAELQSQSTERPPTPSSTELEMSRIRMLTDGRRHVEALAAAGALLAATPDNRELLYLIALNLRCANRMPEALAALERLEQRYPRFSRLFQERGLCYVTLGDVSRAIDAFRQGVNINPALPASWHMLERLYHMTGDWKNAAIAGEQALTLKQLPPEIVAAGALFSDGELTAAERMLRASNVRVGNHVEAMRLLARIEHQREILDDAEALLEAVVKRAPDYHAARFDYARVLIDRQKYLRAREEIDTLLTLDSGNPDYRLLYATATVGLGEHQRAIALYRELLAAAPTSSHLHLLIAHSLKTVGRQKEAIESYRAAVAARPSFGDAYWSLANLKTYPFSHEEIARMRAEEAAPAAQPVDRYHLCFALGKALEDWGEYTESWAYYERGNALKRAERPYRRQITENETRRMIEVCTAPFFAARAGVGVRDPDPILIVGLPRSGSTLVEQILCSHSQVEGTQELFDIPRMALEMGGQRRQPGVDSHYPGVLGELAPEEFQRLGELYMAGTRAHRKNKPFFVDKMGNNFRHIGLIHLMAPNAKIIDVRREPMACCFSNLKQLFAGGQEFAYGIEDIARYYRNYLDLMRHWDAVLPARLMRVVYEDVVEDLEGNVRRILEFCGLEFEPACVEFYKTERSVSTASSEQVRRPIFRDGLFQWRHYEAALEPLKDALGDALIRYRE